MPRFRTSLLPLALLLLARPEAGAHLTYPLARDFGIFTGGEFRSILISGQTTKNWGWADGTDANFARQDDQRYFRFTLTNTASVTITIQALDVVNFLPAVSIFQGLGHAATDPANPDFDTALNTQDYLRSLGEPQPRKGAFDALHTWKIGNGVAPELAVMTYIANIADGTGANYGLAAGIMGDGNADGFVRIAVNLPAGDYTMAVGGANYFTQSDATNYGFSARVAVVPEPSVALLAIGGMAALGFSRRRRLA